MTDNDMLRLFYNDGEYLDKVRDPLAVIVTSHLIVERALQVAVKNKIANYQNIASAKLSFFQSLMLAKSLYPEFDEHHIWTAFGSLNRLRNKIAHRLEPDDVDSILAKIAEGTSAAHPISITDADFSTKFGHVMGYLLGSFNIIIAAENLSL